jgi:hypothetical protein
MGKSDRCLFWFFSFVGLGLLGLGAYALWASPPGPSLGVSETEREVADAVTGSKQVVVFVLDNRGRDAMRVLGVTTC